MCERGGKPASDSSSFPEWFRDRNCVSSHRSSHEFWRVSPSVADEKRHAEILDVSSIFCSFEWGISHQPHRFKLCACQSSIPLTWNADLLRRMPDIWMVITSSSSADLKEISWLIRRRLFEYFWKIFNHFSGDIMHSSRLSIVEWLSYLNVFSCRLVSEIFLLEINSAMKSRWWGWCSKKPGSAAVCNTSFSLLVAERKKSRLGVDFDLYSEAGPSSCRRKSKTYAERQMEYRQQKTSFLIVHLAILVHLQFLYHSRTSS